MLLPRAGHVSADPYQFRGRLDASAARSLATPLPLPCAGAARFALQSALMLRA